MAAKLTIIFGCTASGKASLGREIARRTGGEIISIDSMKVYRRMDIGTAKPSISIREEIPHHLIDVVEPSEEFSVARYVDLAEKAIAEIAERGRPIFVVGGTPLYVKALSEGLFEGPGANEEIRARLGEIAERDGNDGLHAQLEKVDPVSAARIHRNDLRRIVRALEVHELTGTAISELQAQWDRDRTKHDCTFIGLRRDKEDASHRINDRVRKMIADGLVDEVKALLAEPIPLSTAAKQALGYAEIIDHLGGKIELADAVEMIKIGTRQLAKSQRTWFKRFLSAEWIDLAPDARGEVVADELMVRRGSLWSM